VPGDTVEKFWLSAGVQYTGPIAGRDSIMVLSLCDSLGFRGGMQVLLRPLEGEYTNDQLRAQVVSSEQINAYAKSPSEAITQAMGFITEHAHSQIAGVARPPVLLCADQHAERLVRWYFRRFAGFDPFGMGDLPEILSSQWNHTLRYNLPTEQYIGPAASDIAEAQLRMFLHLREQGAWH